jgi:hypothetical protein
VAKPTKIDQYATTARQTAIYPDNARFIYPVLGLAGEYGEVVDEVFTGLKIKPPKATIIKEFGDVLWYVTNTAMDIGFTFQDLADGVTGGLRCDTFEDMAFQRLKPRDQRSPWLRLTIHIGQLAEVAKKGLRDGYGTELTPAKRAMSQMALVGILVALCEICEKQGLSLDLIAAENNKKLTDRQNRDKLQGDGNDR